MVRQIPALTVGNLADVLFRCTGLVQVKDHPEEGQENHTLLMLDPAEKPHVKGRFCTGCPFVTLGG